MKEIIAQTAGRLVEEIFKTIEKVGLSNVGKTAEELLNVLKAGTLELVSAAISEMDAAVLSAKKERKPDRQAHRHCCPAQSLRQTPATRSLRLISPGELDTIPNKRCTRKCNLPDESCVI